MLNDIMRGFALEELEDILSKDGKAEIECSFCKKKYLFTADELQKIIEEKTTTSSHN
jgi:molecular chaperone Hsp33